MNFKKVFLASLAAVTALTTVATTANAETLYEGVVSLKQEASSGIGVKSRTQAQIKSYIASHPFSTTESVSFTTSPDLTSPYDNQGALSTASLNNGLNALNVVRYVAGLDEVKLNSTYNKKAQIGAYVDALNGGISHTPSKPAGINSSIWSQQADEAINNSCNLAAGHINLAKAILAYMDDSDSSNIARLGHRRWCLSPEMEQTGFGQVNTTSGYRYYSNMYVMDNSGANWNTDTTGIAWPAMNMPVEYFGTDQAWSYSLGTSITSPSSVQVTLTRKSDGKTWTFKNGSSDFYVEADTSSTRGARGCVIFRPSGISSYKDGDVYNVKITGLGTTVNYDVNFFDTASAPAKVTNLKAKATSTYADLTWTASSNATSYKIEYYNSGTWQYFTTVTEPSCHITNLAAGYSYKFRVTAVNGSKSSSAVTVEFTAPKSGTTTTGGTSTSTSTTTKPDKVTNFKASTATANSIKLTWSKVTGADSYQVEIYKNSKWTKLTKTTGTSYTATGLTKGTSYKFRIFAYKGTAYSSSTTLTASTTGTTSGSSGSSGSTSTSTSSGVLAAVPTFKATPSTTSVKLSWTKATGADSYQVDIYKNGKWTKLTKTTGTSCTATGLDKNTSYKFRIFAFKGSAYSGSVQLTVKTGTTATVTATGKPSAVTGFKGTPSSTSVKMTWNKNTKADSYQIDIYKNGKWTKLTKTTGTSFTATGLTKGTTYKFRIFAFNGSLYSASKTITVTL